MYKEGGLRPNNVEEDNIKRILSTFLRCPYNKVARNP